MGGREKCRMGDREEAEEGSTWGEGREEESEEGKCHRLLHNGMAGMPGL